MTVIFLVLFFRVSHCGLDPQSHYLILVFLGDSHQVGNDGSNGASINYPLCKFLKV